MSRHKELLAKYNLLEECYKSHKKQSEQLYKQSVIISARNSNLEQENSILKKENKKLKMCRSNLINYS